MKKEDRDHILSLLVQVKQEILERKLFQAIRKLREIEAMMDSVEVENEGKEPEAEMQEP